MSDDDDTDTGNGEGEGGEGGEEAELLEQIRADPAKAAQQVNALRSEAAEFRRKLRKAEEERDEARNASRSDSERALADAEKKGADGERGKWSRRLVEADLRSAAAGVLRDPQDAVRYVDVAALLELDEDERDLPKRVKALVAEKPYLGVEGSSSSGENGRQGARSQGVRTTSASTSSAAAADGDAWLRKAARRP